MSFISTGDSSLGGQQSLERRIFLSISDHCCNEVDTAAGAAPSWLGSTCAVIAMRWLRLIWSYGGLFSHEAGDDARR
jgi:hypothetical protein